MGTDSIMLLDNQKQMIALLKLLIEITLDTQVTYDTKGYRKGVDRRMRLPPGRSPARGKFSALRRWPFRPASRRSHR